MCGRDMDDPREVARADVRYDELDKDINDLFNKDDDIPIDMLDRDGIGKELWREMDDETRAGFEKLDENEQREIIEGIREGRMSLQEARHIIDRKRD